MASHETDNEDGRHAHDTVLSGIDFEVPSDTTENQVELDEELDPLPAVNPYKSRVRCLQAEERRLEKGWTAAAIGEKWDEAAEIRKAYNENFEELIRFCRLAQGAKAVGK